MTEQEAKTKWCPFARVGDKDGVAYNRWRLDFPPARFKTTACLGSACMAFRWAIEPHEQPSSLGGDIEGQCYCGLAGKP